MKAEAIVFREPNIPRLEEIELPELNDDEIRIKTAFSGVSIGTESSIFSGKRTHNGTFPFVGGYMVSGIVENLGSQVANFKIGDRVVAMGNRLAHGVKSIWGGHCSWQTANAAKAVVVPADVDMREAAMFVLPNVGLNAVGMLNITEHDIVLIQGQGLIGQIFGQWVRNRGAKVITIEPNPNRAALSKEYVTNHVLNPVTDDLKDAIENITMGMGPTIVVEATGSKKLICEATKFLKRGGKMMFLSWYPGNIEIDFLHFHSNQVTAFFPNGAGDVETTRATLNSIAAGSIKIGDNITDVISSEKACEGYHRIISGDDSIMGMVIDWS